MESNAGFTLNNPDIVAEMEKGIENRELRKLEWKVELEDHRTAGLQEGNQNEKMTTQASTQVQVIPKFGKQKKAFRLGKSIITDFIQRSVLGTQLIYKTSDSQMILGSFNRKLQGKDKVIGDIMEIHEKYKSPTHYKNFISTIVFTNENTLRMENDDRCTVFLDLSPSHKGDLEYFKKLGNAMKYLGVSEAFYAYLRAIADAYPDFNGNPPPMTTSKQDHIISTLPPLF
ncbi:hypothetical protein RhiirC2_792952 [Rhizophagus irregularis]|uniref:Uncharacterized protein n=1 Tax=Rhizophagus irregularis TaxID=588596 RepID=A0A2N1MGD6_9GLOM|nr:hypothetical protein RhiirC2_792952 [Rhizophagus irregularis]